jgi:hypothetical protein
LLHDAMRLPNRLLALVTDGIAYDQDYQLSNAAADAKRALAEAGEAGTACVCLSVGGGTDSDKLQEAFGADNLLAVDEVGEVTARIRDVCRHALASVGVATTVPPQLRRQCFAANVSFTFVETASNNSRPASSGCCC